MKTRRIPYRMQYFAEANLIKSEDLIRAREIDFVYQFNSGLKKLLEVLGTTRKIAKTAGTNLKAYRATGTLEDGNVAEGEVIPLSKYETEAVTFAEITLNKWRKATTAEAIAEKGYDQAVNMTTAAMVKDVQKGIKKTFFDFLKTGTGRASGENTQATLAAIWSQLQILFEDDEIESVYFMNPIDISDYLAQHQITLESAFGFSYVENFLGLGTVITSGSVPHGKIYGTAKSNIILYFIAVNGADIGRAFQFTSDETGYIGIHEKPDYDNMTCTDTVMSGLVLFAERIDGLVVGTIGGSEDDVVITLDRTSATIPVDGTVTLNASVAPVGTEVTWTSSDPDKASVIGGVVTGIAAGTATITAKAGNMTATCEVTVSAGA